MKFDVRSPRSWVAALAMATLIPFAAPASAGLTNGGFEETALSPWEASVGASLVNTEHFLGSNSIRFSSVDGSNYAYLTQPSIVLQSGSYDLKYYLKGTVPQAQDEFLVGLFVGSTVFDSFALGTGSDAGNDWTLYSHAVNVQAETTFRLSFTADTAGDPNFPGTEASFNFYLDEVSFNRQTGTVPEPGSLLLVGVALAGVAVARRRKMV